MNLIYLDTETTGNEIGKDRICQICYKVGDKVENHFFKPPIPITVKAMSITHITNKMVEDKEPFEGSKIKEKLEKLLANNGVLIAHNAKFDIAMLEAEGVSVPRYICTLRVARYLDPENIIPEYNLQFLRYFLDLDVEGRAHDAEGDVSVLEALFSRLLEKMKEKVGDEEKAIEKMIEVSKVPTLFSVFNFGKYKGQKIEDILNSDKRYLEWMFDTKMKNEEGEEDWIYTLKYYLGK